MRSVITKSIICCSFLRDSALFIDFIVSLGIVDQRGPYFKSEEYGFSLQGREKLQEWLDEIAKHEKLGPKVAFDCFMQVAEYHVPKLARVEQVGDETKPVVHIYKWKDD